MPPVSPQSVAGWRRIEAFKFQVQPDFEANSGQSRLNRASTQCEEINIGNLFMYPRDSESLTANGLHREFLHDIWIWISSKILRISTKVVQEVDELYGKKDFASIAYEVTPEEVCILSTKDYEAYDSRTSIVKNVMDELRGSNNTDMIGVYGIGGVGKTTLVKEIYEQATKGESLFDEVVMVLDLKQNPSIERIQKEIAEKLGLKLPENVTPAGRAHHICSRMKEKKTLVILDDVWENIDLEVVGLPRMATLKILLTSRSKIVLSRDMGTQNEFHLDLLGQEETWNLFQKMAGDIVKKPDIQTVAIQVAEKCGGTLTVVVAR